MGCHTNQAFFIRAVRVLREAANELLDFIEANNPGRTAPLAGVAVGRPVTPGEEAPRGVGTGKTEEESSGGAAKEEKETDPPAGAKTAESLDRNKLPLQEYRHPSEKTKREGGERADSAQKAKKEKRKDKDKGRSRSRGRESQKDTETKERSPSPSKTSPPGPIRPSSSRAKRERSPEKDPDIPPGQWTLKESPGWRVISTGRPPLDRSQRPPEPAGPPPHWKGEVADDLPKSKGVKKRERSKDINTFGFSAERKAQRLRKGR